MDITDLYKIDLNIPDEIYEYADNYKRSYGEKKFSVVSCYQNIRNELVLRTFAFKNDRNDKKLFEISRRCREAQITRNLHYYGMAGWHVNFPGEKSTSWYYGYNTIWTLEEWEGTGKDFYNVWGMVIDLETADKLAVIGTKYPYLLKKYPEIVSVTPDQLFRLINQYEKSTSIEWLLQNDMPNIAMDKRLNTLTKNKKTEIIKYIQDKTPEQRKSLDRLGLTAIMKMIKDGITERDYIEIQYYGVHCKKDVEYIKKQKMEKWNSVRWKDYLEMAKNNGHDITLSYWRYPKDVNAAHDRMMEEKNFIIKTENEAKYGAGLKEIYGKLNEKIEWTNGKYRIYIPTDYADIEKQCDVLYQCLIRSGYVEKMMKKEELLVFIRDNNDKPIATAEILGWSEKKLGQFYTDERDRAKCIPNEELKTMLNEWLAKADIKKPKEEIRQHYFKGFLEDMKTMVGKPIIEQYEVGKTYDTGCPDSEFNEKCKSSKNAIHFCKDIHAVNRFINARYIAEIEPLGKVCHVGDEYFSNRIKVVRIIDNAPNLVGA